MSKKLRMLALVFALVIALTACGSAAKPAEDTSKDKPADTANTTEVKDTEGKKKVALLCDIAGTQVYILDLIDGLKKAAEKHGFEYIIAESADNAAYEDNARGLINEGVDLIIGGNWQAGEALSVVSEEFPDACDYALIDATIDAENVKCIAYHEAEGAYLIGKLAALTAKPEEKIFGGVHVNEGQGSFKWRYGLREAVLSVIPDAEFLYNYVGSYSDPAKAKEYAIQQYEQGARFINAAAAGGDSGVFEAAKEKGFYTSGQDVDLTSPDNEYILTCQLKDSSATIMYVLDQYFTEGAWNTDDITLGIAEGAIGAVYVTHDSKNPRNPILTDEIIDELKATAEKLKSGEIDMKNIPSEEDYFKNK